MKSLLAFYIIIIASFVAKVDSVKAENIFNIQSQLNVNEKPFLLSQNETNNSNNTNNDNNKNVLLTALMAVIPALSGYFVVYLRRETKKIEEDTLNKLDKRKPLEPGEFRNSILLVGLGGSGKTTLIGYLVDQGNSEMSTRDFANYKSLSESIDKNGNTYKFYIADYPGQNIGVLIKGLMAEQKVPYSPMTFNGIDSIIIVVDLVYTPEPGSKIDMDLVRQTWQERVQQHIKEWSPTALDCVFGLVGKNIKYFCLFINKFDILNEMDKNIDKEKVLTEYRELNQNISQRARGFVYKPIIGSFTRGDGLVELTQDLKKYSESLKNLDKS
ncbi:MAG: GTPase domain-containing protein [Aphanizomenon flos-aquae DEX188]|jgi:GTPase SAR1 family protein|nr:MAG: GTPase domain-containing protein [Aphanizomenon flos-aquae DEX188]